MVLSLREIEVVYRSRGADFFRFALARTGDPEAARDAVQEGFAQAIRHRRSYRRIGPAEAWIARCVLNAAHDSLRRLRADHLSVDVIESTTATEQLNDPDQVVIREAVRRLPPRQRTALFLRFYLGFDYALIGKVLGVRVGTVSAMLHAARTTLADELQEVAR
jgi:RNA polymerase sigma-70 factor (ECF subfamily)